MQICIRLDFSFAIGVPAESLIKIPSHFFACCWDVHSVQVSLLASKVLKDSISQSKQILLKPSMIKGQCVERVRPICKHRHLIRVTIPWAIAARLSSIRAFFRSWSDWWLLQHCPSQLLK